MSKSISASLTLSNWKTRCKKAPQSPSWMVLSHRDIMKVLLPLQIKVPGTAAGGKAKKAKKIAKNGSISNIM
jgi:hypothetical protein